MRPAAPAHDPAPEPWRVLFPLGAAAAALGAWPWLAHGLGWVGGWPWDAHAVLLVQGFELAFVCGFLLTAMPAFTHGPRATRREALVPAAAIAAGAVAALAGVAVAAHLAGALALAATLLAVARRVRSGAAAPPDEFLLVGLGMLLGLAGMLAQAAVALGLLAELAPRFASRLLSRGMMLALVLGLGGRLVPTFAMMQDPLTIIGFGRAGERPRRRWFVGLLAALLLAALLAEALGHRVAGAWTRAAAGAMSLLLAWKLWRPPGRSSALGNALIAAGWCTLAGLLWAAVDPAREVTAWHLVFIGGYGLLTAAIGTRVLGSHGGHGLPAETRVLSPTVLTAIALALALRLASDFGLGPHARTAAAALWCAAWGLWLARAVPLARAPRPTLITLR